MYIKTLFKTLACICMACAAVACNVKSKSGQNTADGIPDTADSSSVANDAQTSQAAGAHTKVYDIDEEESFKLSASIEGGKVTLRIAETVEVDPTTGLQCDYAQYSEYLGQDFTVEGLEGTCKAVFFGNWGDKVNPLLCMLMDDGGVEILDINNAVRNYDFVSSGRLPGLQNIVSFQHSSNSIGGTGIVAIDKDGNKFDIDVFAGIDSSTLFLYENASMEHRLSLSPDWKFTFSSTVEFTEPYELFFGRFRGKTYFDINETTTYSFEYIDAKNIYKEDLGQALKGQRKNGSFSITKIKSDSISNDYEIEILSGEINLTKDNGSKAIYSDLVREFDTEDIESY